MDHRDEAELCRGIQRGDPDAVETFLRRSHRAVYAYACRLTADPDLREDWAHDSLLRILDDIEHERFVFRHPGSLWSWFSKRAYFLLLDRYRSHRKEQDRLQPQADLDYAPGTEDPEADLARIETAAALHACLDGIPSDPQRRALRFFLVQELKYTEIAEIMRTSLNNVRTWVRRGRLSLRECLAEKLELTWEVDS